MAGQRDCDSAVISGRLAKANEFFDAAEHLEGNMLSAAGDLFVNAGIASADVICCVRLGVHSNTGNRNEACALLKKTDTGSERHLATLLSLKNKAAYTHEPISATECTKMKRAAGNLLETAKRAVASGR